MHWEIKKNCSFDGGPWIKGLKQCSGGGGPWVGPWRCGLRQIERRGPGRVRDHQFQEIWLMRVLQRGLVNGGATLKVVSPLA